MIFHAEPIEFERQPGLGAPVEILRDEHGIWGGKTPAQRRHLIATQKETAA